MTTRTVRNRSGQRRRTRSVAAGSGGAVREARQASPVVGDALSRVLYRGRGVRGVPAADPPHGRGTPATDDRARAGRVAAKVAALTARHRPRDFDGGGLLPLVGGSGLLKRATGGTLQHVTGRLREEAWQ
jgi:hypothetical protein